MHSNKNVSELDIKLRRPKDHQTIALSSRTRKVPSLSTKPDKSVQFAQEILVDKEPTTIAEDQDQRKQSILKNGTNYRIEKLPIEVQRFTAMNIEVEKIVKQEEESRQFFNQWTDKMQNKERLKKEVLEKSWKYNKNPVSSILPPE